MFKIALNAADLTSLKNDLVCALQLRCYLSFAGISVTDLEGNVVQPISAQSGLAVRTFTSDTIKPLLPTSSGFVSLTLHTCRTTLSFSEPVDVSTFKRLTLAFRNTFETGLRSKLWARLSDTCEPSGHGDAGRSDRLRDL